MTGKSVLFRLLPLILLINWTQIIAAPTNPHGEINLDCSTCHSVTSWSDTKKADQFPHDKTGFSLNGAHDDIKCAACHSDLTFEKTPNQCVDCHMDIHQGELGDYCQSCHATSSWEDQQDILSLHAERGFPLTGVHAAADCQACHQNQLREEFAGTPQECQGCHYESFKVTDNPDHLQAGFSVECQDCHGNRPTGWRPADWEHPPTTILQQAHLGLMCIDCHSVRYAGTTDDCYDCHSNDFEGAENPDHVAATFPQDCNVCHSMTAWEPAEFDHDLTAFPLVGAHLQVDCQNCHASGYTGTPTDCFSCHESVFSEADDPDHPAGNFDHDCTGCHSMTAWEPATFDHNLTDFALTGAHQSVQCQSCHTEGYTNTPSDCYSCHLAAYEEADPDHIANGFSQDCTQCHTTTAWEPAQFDHNLTDFPLTGAHTPLQCQSCHSEGYTGTSPECYSCHLDSYTGADDPDHVANNFDQDCTQCHSTTAWEPADSDHNLTEFPLTGAHTPLQCQSCHAEGYTGTATECYACHETAFTSAGDPDHVANDFDHDCTQCHNTSAWEPSTFSHDQTGFILDGAHVSLQCLACHLTGYAGTINTCYGCHDGDYQSVTEPNHALNNFDQDCTQCHTTTAWSPSTFDHDATNFPLTGAHQVLQCLACHSQGFAGTPIDCYSCHTTEYDNSEDPNHVLAGFTTDCTQCHSTNSWDPANWDHSSTGFELTGAHIDKDCQSCHANGYVNTNPACFSCHQEEFASASDPDHASNNLPQDCTLCHNTTSWEPSTFDHVETGFVLDGAHNTLQCFACHSDGYVATDPACYSCHADNFAATTDPDHEVNGFEHDCTRCHNTTAWLPSTFDHSTTQFPLTGAHAVADCISCHASGYSLLPTDCYSCHNSEFASVVDPDHQSNNFDHDCTQCHNTAAWIPATFDHNPTEFPITGAHVGLPCLACHSEGYAGTSSFCYDCHQGDFESVIDPNHVANGFSFDCTDCHTTGAWSPSIFDHGQTGFALTGAHLLVQCLACHSGGYAGTPSQCYACHQSDYDGTTDPSHTAAQFPTTCETCHTTEAWEPANWDHDAQYFPIYSGKHSGKWDDCTDCHVVPTDFTTYECIFCHEHNQSDTDNDHSEVNNYQYNSVACLNCHPTGDN